jgi:hypothetical protein
MIWIPDAQARGLELSTLGHQFIAPAGIIDIASFDPQPQLTHGHANPNAVWAKGQVIEGQLGRLLV